MTLIVVAFHGKSKFCLVWYGQFFYKWRYNIFNCYMTSQDHVTKGSYDLMSWSY